MLNVAGELRIKGQRIMNTRSRNGLLSDTIVTDACKTCSQIGEEVGWMVGWLDGMVQICGKAGWSKLVRKCLGLQSDEPMDERPNSLESW